MTDEAKPPKKKPAGAARRPRKQAADAAKRPRASASKPKPEATADTAAAEPAAAVDAETAATPPSDAPTEAMSLDDAPTEAVTPDDDATEVVAADAATTQVLADDAAATQVTPAAGGPAPPSPPAPPFAPVPRAVTPSGEGERRTTLWILLAVAAVAVVVLVVVWAFALRDSGEQFVGSWAPVSGEGGGLVITMQDDGFEVAMYDTDLQLTGSYPATHDGDTLSFRFTDTQTQLGQVKATLTYVEDRDVLVLRLSAMGQEGAAMEFARVDVLEAGATPTPTPVPTPTPSPTASPTGSPSPTPSPTGTDTAQYDQQVVDGIVKIQVGVLNWASANSNVYPPVAEVTADGGVGQYVSPWPTNPFTGQPMTAGDQPGDYTYEQLSGGQAYKLVGHLANGLTFTVP